jgi:type IV pilus assembly protein PilM
VTDLLLPKFLRRLVAEPPPAYLFEVSSSAVAMVEPADPLTLKQQPLPPSTLNVSPSSSNLPNAEPFRAALDRLVQVAPGKHATAALVIPDFAARMAVLDFDELPDDARQRTSLIRFRLRKSVPFAIDEAHVSYTPQRRDDSRAEVLAVAIDRNVLSEYERVFVNAGFRVGLVIPSSLACLPLCRVDSEAQVLTLLLKLSGSILTVMLIDGGAIRLVRCVDFTERGQDGELAQTSPFDFSPVGESMPVLSQTMAYAEDELGRRVKRLLLSGFGKHDAEISLLAEQEMFLTGETLRSRFAPAQSFAGLLGLLEDYAA